MPIQNNENLQSQPNNNIQNTPSRSSQIQEYRNQVNTMRASQNVSMFCPPIKNNMANNNGNQGVKKRFLSFFPISSNYFGKLDSNKKENPNKDELGNTIKFKSFTPDEKLCKICYFEESNTIVNACGHGGVCKNCAKDVLKKMGKCVMCRNPIDKIYVIKIIDHVKIELIEELKPG